MLYVHSHSTVKDLRQIAKERGLRGYSKLQKAELIEFLRKSAPRDTDNLHRCTRPELVKRAKRMGIQGFYKLKDLDLAILLWRTDEIK